MDYNFETTKCTNMFSGADKMDSESICKGRFYNDVACQCIFIIVKITCTFMLVLN